VRNSILERVIANLHMMGADPAAAQMIKPVRVLEDAVANATYVTEAAPEKLDVKQAIFAEPVRLAPEDCILASNTSVIPITNIADGLPTAHRIIGTHWWNPPYLVPLVEVVQAKYTCNTTIAATRFVARSHCDGGRRRVRCSDT
jgi:3-hydroxybutyryl-CoA dehydrogenase